MRLAAVRQSVAKSLVAHCFRPGPSVHPWTRANCQVSSALRRTLFRMTSDARRRRDARIVRLDAAGWSLREIGRDPRVRLSPEGVRHVLRQLNSEPEPWELDPLLLWRDARAGDARARELLTEMTARTDELAARWSVERFGKPLAGIGPEASRSLRSEAADVIGVQMYAELTGAPR